MDAHAALQPDPTHSGYEARVRVTGLSSRGRLLVVVVALLDDDTVRIISARRPTKGERHEYEGR
jgi:uncharacterized DUF497 family protein